MYFLNEFKRWIATQNTDQQMTLRPQNYQHLLPIDRPLFTVDPKNYVWWYVPSLDSRLPQPLF